MATAEGASPPATVTLTRTKPAPGSEVRMLGMAAPVPWEVANSQAAIHLPVQPLPCQHAWVLKMTPEPAGM